MKTKLKEKLIIISITTIIISVVNLLLFPHLLKTEEPMPDNEAVGTSPSATENYQSALLQENQPLISTTLSEPISIPMTVDISSPYAGLYNLSTGATMYEKSAESRIHPASLTKLLTAITALNYLAPDTVITVGTELELLPKRSSLCLIKKGHRLTLYDLLTGMLVASGNDAAYTIAVNTARSILNQVDISDKEALSYFTELMNSTAKTIGCTKSKFTTPDGFDSEEQYTTIRDLMLICDYALNFKEIREITSTVKKKVVFESGENITWSNSNKLLHQESAYYYKHAIGMKTGTTPLAGLCLASVADINGQTYLAVVCGCKSENDRYLSSIKLFDFASSI